MANERHALVAIFGPTGIGKTDVAVELAERLRMRGDDPVAISADALQVYSGLETLSGAADAAQQSRLEHRLISFVPIDSTFSVGEYMPLAHREIDAALVGGRRPIVVGGTGLYLRAALTELDLKPPPDPGVRERWSKRLEDIGPEALHAELAELAPWVVERVPPTDKSRIVRALELLEMGEIGPPGEEPEESQLWTAETRVPTLLFGLVIDREELYRRIEARVDAMVAAGADEEVRMAEAARASRTARKALGYQELLGGDIEAMKRRTRQYAKRQLTWMRKLAGVRMVDVTGRGAADVAAEIAAALEAGTAGPSLPPAAELPAAAFFETGFEAWNAGDSERFVEGFHPDAIWNTVGSRVEGAPLRGHDEIRGYLERLRSEWGVYRVVLEDARERGDLALVLGRFEAKSRTSEGGIHLPAAWIFRRRDGLVAEARTYTDRAEALAAFAEHGGDSAGR